MTRVRSRGILEGACSGSRGLCLVIMLALVLRGGALLVRSQRFDDPDNYLPLARSMVEGRGLALNGRLTAYRPPLYPMVLAGLLKIAGDRVFAAISVLHLGLGAATVGLTWRVARRCGLEDRSAVLAAFIVAADPVLVWESRSIMTETLAAFLVAWSLESLSSPRRHKDWTSGILIGLATLCRPSLLIGSGLAVAARGFYAAGPWPLRAWAALRIVLAIMMVLCPWALRNALLFGEPVWTTTHGGYTLALANNPVYYRDVVNGPPDRVWEGQEQWLWWDSINKATSGMTEPQADRFLRMSAVRLMASQPNTFIKATWQRVTRFWSIAPSSAVYSPRIRLICAIWTIPLWTALIFGLKTSRSWTYPLVYACLTVFGLTLVHTLYWTDMRMRAPIVPAIALIAAVPFTRSPVNPPSGDERENCPLPEGV